MKCVKIEEKLLCTTYRNSPTLFRTVPSPTLYGLPFLEIEGLQLSYPFIPGTCKATDFKFDRYIYRANPNKSPLKIWRNGSVGVSRDCPNFGGTLFQERVKLRISNFEGTFIGWIRTKAHEKCWE